MTLVSGMKLSRLSFGITVVLLLAGSFPVFATPSENEVRLDIKAFQQFFKGRFPSLTLDAYENGIYALPQSIEQKRSWELINDFSPQKTGFQRGWKKWNTPFTDNTTFDDCFEGKPGAHRYPYFNGEQVRTIAADINECLQTQKLPKLNPTSTEMAALVAVYKSKSNGLPMNVEFRRDPVRALYKKGRDFFWSKRGQLNYSCADCHIHNAGNRMRGDIIGPALGQTTGSPAFRIEGMLKGNPWTTIHQQYRVCQARMQSVPLDAQSEEYIALELYQAIMNTGVPIKAPSIRK